MTPVFTGAGTCYPLSRAQASQVQALAGMTLWGREDNVCGV